VHFLSGYDVAWSLLIALIFGSLGLTVLALLWGSWWLWRHQSVWWKWPSFGFALLCAASGVAGLYEMIEALL
jgi:hypothetical protein